MEIRYHLDENVNGAIAEGLRRRGIDVTTADGAGRLSASDEEHLAFSRKQGRVVVTHDPDFLKLHTRGVDHAGIAFSHSGRRSIGEIIRGLSRIVVTRTAEGMRNRVEYL